MAPAVGCVSSPSPSSADRRAPPAHPPSSHPADVAIVKQEAILPDASARPDANGCLGKAPRFALLRISILAGARGIANLARVSKAFAALFLLDEEVHRRVAAIEYKVPLAEPAPFFVSRRDLCAELETTKVYTWGEGGGGRLGQGDTDARLAPAEVVALRGLPVKQIAAGAAHCAVLTWEEAVWTWGLAVRRAGTAVDPHVPSLRSPAEQRASEVRPKAEGKDPPAADKPASDRNGAVADDVVRRLGAGDGVPALPTGRRIFCNSCEVGVVSVGPAGLPEVAVWGDQNAFRRHSAAQSGALPQIPSALQKINVRLCATGTFHSVCVSFEGLVYTWAPEMPPLAMDEGAPNAPHLYVNQDGGAGVLFQDSLQPPIGREGLRSTPTVVPLPDGARAHQVAAGSRHTLALCGDGNVYSWGMEYTGHLLLHAKRPPSTPERIEALHEICWIGAGERYGAAVDRYGVMYCWGRGAIVGATERYVRVPRPVSAFIAEHERVIEASAGRTHLIVRTCHAGVEAAPVRGLHTYSGAIHPSECGECLAAGPPLPEVEGA